MHVLYISYDGLAEALGQSQVLPYVRGLRRLGHSFDVLSFEKSPDPLAWRQNIEPGIRWTGLRYHRKPTLPATAFDISWGVVAGAFAGSNVELVHCRSYVAATIGLVISKILRVPLLFDMRGLWPEERADAGLWRRDSTAYRSAKQMEGVLLRSAAGVVVLTNAMRDFLRQHYGQQIKGRIDVIPTCCDLDLFSPEAEPDPALAAAVGDAHALIYLGTLAERNLVDETAEFYLAWRKVVGKAKFIILSRDLPEAFVTKLRSVGAETEIIHQQRPRDQVPRAIQTAKAGIFMYRGSMATKGVAPTKLGELLGCGKPVVGNASVGDVSRVISSDVGALLKTFSAEAMLKAAEQLAQCAANEDTTGRCVKLAQEWFSLEHGLQAFGALYTSLGQRNPQMIGTSEAAEDRAWPRLMNNSSSSSR